ncbi:MAG TPA: hypothetical protein VJ999_05070 [Candidatus Sulfotelmatobacter sp.]|nr:hypothetical protein [Candidatus Sulfotelmatobacter sp.]
MKHLRLLLAAAGTLMSAAPGASAQAASTQSGTTAVRVTESFGFGPAGTIVPPKAHAPFSAVLVERSEDALTDGVNINRENEEVVMRDGAGRIYRARKIKAVGAGERNARPGAVPSAGPSAVPRMIVTITDPVEHVQYTCTPIKVCRKMGYRQWPNGRGPRPGPYPPLDLPNDRSVTVEDLGTATLSGVEVEGKRLTRVIPEGTVGNDRPFTTVEEIWHSKELDVNVQVKRSDPRWGTRTATMTEINLGEPDASYFQIPEGYRVEEGLRRMSPQPQVEPFPQQNQ